ncbi:MAG TPA: hypothetical protein VFF48_12935 [Brevundimonas sp.]|nr:hypothetical protein [Brevundimonas sp.]
MLILILGPIVAILYPLLSVVMDGTDIGRAIGTGVRVLLGSAFIGGVLRLLVSVDARLEAKA